MMKWIFEKVKTVLTQINDSKYNLVSKARNTGWYIGNANTNFSFRKVLKRQLTFKYKVVVCGLLDIETEYRRQRMMGQ